MARTVSRKFLEKIMTNTNATELKDQTKYMSCTYIQTVMGYYGYMFMISSKNVIEGYGRV
jgi:hypothetical protein